MVVYAAVASPAVTWFSAGQRWHDDSWVCPECGGAIVREAGDWRCTACPLRRPKPDWVVEDDGVVDPTGAWHRVQLQLPGTVNIGLRVTDNGGKTDTTTSPLTVNAGGTSNYGDAVLDTPGLIDYWRLGETSEDMSDSSNA